MDNLLHSVPSKYITSKEFYACVEIPSHSKNKYEYNEEMGALVIDRILYTSTHYPHNYGFIPKTWGQDEDPLDVLVIASEPLVPLSLTKCRPIGVLEMIDNGMHDEKIIAVCLGDPFYNNYTDISQFPQHLLDEIQNFFTVYKILEHGKETEVKEFQGHIEAENIVQKGIERYKEKFPNK